MGCIFAQSGFVKVTEYFLPDLNFPISLLLFPVMPGKIIFAAFSQLVSNCVPLYSRLKHWEILRTEFQTEPLSSSFFDMLWHPHQYWQHEPAPVLPWLHERTNFGCAWCTSSHPPNQTQVRPGPGLTTRLKMHLSNQITTSSFFLPSKTQVSPAISSSQSLAQPPVFLIYNLLCAFSCLPLICITCLAFSSISNTPI